MHTDIRRYCTYVGMYMLTIIVYAISLPSHVPSMYLLFCSPWASTETHSCCASHHPQSHWRITFSVFLAYQQWSHQRSTAFHSDNRRLTRSHSMNKYTCTLQLCIIYITASCSLYVVIQYNNYYTINIILLLRICWGNDHSIRNPTSVGLLCMFVFCIIG